MGESKRKKSARRARSESGAWRDGRATPQLLRPELRALPADLVTKDVDDPDRVHDLDAPHIVGALAEEYDAKQTGTAEVPEEKPDLEWKPVKQEFVDLLILRAHRAIIEREQGRMEEFPGYKPEFWVQHLWFPENDIRVYSLEDGNPPPESLRPKHLRGVDLVVDVKGGLPKRLVDDINRNAGRRKIYAGTLTESVARARVQRMLDGEGIILL